MKKLIYLLIFMSTTTLGSTQKTINSNSFYRRALIKLNLKEDLSKNFSYGKFHSYSKKSGGYRRVKGRIKNIGIKDFKWVSFVIYIGDSETTYKEVHVFTINNFKRGKTYLFNKNIHVGSIKGRKVALSYLDSSAEKK